MNRLARNAKGIVAKALKEGSICGTRILRTFLFPHLKRVWDGFRVYMGLKQAQLAGNFAALGA